MKTTFDLPEPLLRRAKAAAAHQGRPLRDLVADALESKLSADDASAQAESVRANAWAAFQARLQKLPDGSWFNPDGIEDTAFFEVLDTLRAERHGWQPRDPFAPAADQDPSQPASAEASAAARRTPRTPRKPG